MQVIGTAPVSVLTKIERRGYTREQAIYALLAEAERRFPKSYVSIIHSVNHDGVDVVVL